MIDTSDIHDHIFDLLDPIIRLASDCHAASLMIAASASKVGLPDPPHTRVARGSRKGVGGQHSWVVIGDPYDPEWIIDPTLWHYLGQEPSITIVAGNGEGADLWIPAGKGSIWDWGRPPEAIDEEHVLDPPASGWSHEAKRFLELIVPLDLAGWRVLAHAPVQGWPSREIILQMSKDEKIAPHIPIDIVGMLTDRNPKGLYW